MFKIMLGFAFAVLAAGFFACSKPGSNDDGYFTAKGIVVDRDSKLPIAGARVKPMRYQIAPNAIVFGDSTLTDNKGIYSLRMEKEYSGAVGRMVASKSEDYFFLIHPSSPNLFWEVFDTLYLARKSYINVTTHRVNSYLPGDSVNILVSGDYESYTGLNILYRQLSSMNANSQDKIFHLSTIYKTPYNNTKLYFRKEHVRNGWVIAAAADSAEILQFGTKDFILNY